MTERTVTFEATTEDLLSLKQAWVEGGNDEVKFDLTCGAGVGSPLMRLRVEVNGRFMVETVDIRVGLVAWVDRLVVELREQEKSDG